MPTIDSREQSLKIGRVRLGQVPRVVLSVWKSSSIVSRPTDHGVDLFEVRVDRLAQRAPQQVCRFVQGIRQHGLPVIGTVRSHREGGNADLTDTERLALYQEMAPLVDAIDVELSSTTILEEVVGIGRRHQIVVIVSFHDFSSTPPDKTIEGMIEGAGRAGANIIKVATFARAESDVIRLLQLTWKHRSRQLITIAMGRIGAISRVVFPLAGSLLTYTSVTPVDGQLPLRELVGSLRRYYPKLDR